MCARAETWILSTILNLDLTLGNRKTLYYHLRQISTLLICTLFRNHISSHTKVLYSLNYYFLV